MLGRMRLPSWSSLEELEMERSDSPKLIKDDSLSIYETTRMKLKQGAQRNTSLEYMDSTWTDNVNLVASIPPVDEEDAMSDTDCTSSASSAPQSAGQQPIQKERQNKNVSVLSLFARYKNNHCASRLIDQKAIVVENGCISSDTSVISNDVN